MMVEGLAVSRFLHTLALSMLFGGVLFPLYRFADPHRMWAWIRPMLLSAAWLALASAVSWLAFTVAGIPSGTPGLAIAGWLIWGSRLAASAGLVLFFYSRHATRQRFRIALVGSLILLASIAWTGDPGNNDTASAPIHVFADVLHLIAAGVWVGALFVFARLAMLPLRDLRGDGLRLFHDALAGFSDIGSMVVAILTFTGILLIWLQNVSAVFAMVYGQVLLLKLALFAGMLLLAAANRFWLTPRLSKTLDLSQGSPKAVAALRMSLVAETALGVLVLAAAAWLGALPPSGAE